MQFILPIIAIIILGAAEFSMNTFSSPSLSPTPSPKTSEEDQEEVKSPTHEVKKTSDSSVKVIVTVAPTSHNEESSTLQNYLYPGGNIIYQNGSETHLETSDSPQAVTDWYKNYIQEKGMNTTSFVTTNTNNNVLNRLVGAGNGQKIDIEIKKNESDSKTTVKILLNQ